MVRSGLKIKPKYEIKRVHEAIENGFYRVTQSVWEQIYDDFGWKTSELEIFFKRLKKEHFDKRMPMKKKPPHNYYGEHPAIYDVYKSEDILGEKVYTHFYFNEDFLIIDSVHEQ